MRRSTKRTALTLLVLLSASTIRKCPAQSSQPTGAATSRVGAQLTPRAALLEAAHAWVSGAFGPECEVELNGTMLSFRELDARVERLVERDLRPSERALAIVDEILHDAILDELRRLGAWEPEIAEAKFARYAAPLDATPFNATIVATRFKGFPSRASYQRHFLLRSAFEDHVLGEVQEATLEARHAELAGFFANQSLGLECLRFEHGKRGGSQAARAAAAAARLAWESGKPFRELFAASDAIATMGATGSSFTLNTLRTLTGDTEYARFVRGESLADELFARSERGRILGPCRGVDADFVVRIAPAPAAPPEEQPARKPLDDRTRELVHQILLEERFLAWSRETLERAVLRVQRR